MDSKKIIDILRKVFEKSGFNLIVIIGFAGIILLSFDEIFTQEKKTEQTVCHADTYRRYIEETLTELLSSVHGAGQVKVMVTLESGEENVYAWQEKTTQDVKTVAADVNGQQSDRYTYENEIVMVSDGNDKKALVEKTLQPTVQGVVVVCAGADDIKVVSDITDAVSVALNVSSNRICVIKMK
ncbi:MAG: hypothetical protein IJ362_05345 [Oscillospiraceae bacterium]|nr:hypothetical protein [Oscillospiraceae bacterium]